MNEEKLIGLCMELTGASEGLARRVIIHLGLGPRDFVRMLDADNSLCQPQLMSVNDEGEIGADSASPAGLFDGGWETLPQQSSVALAK